MPEPPDFDAIARSLLRDIQDDACHGDSPRAVAHELRCIWNARGAADLAAIDEVAHTNEGPIAFAIRSLDR